MGAKKSKSRTRTKKLVLVETFLVGKWEQQILSSKLGAKKLVKLKKIQVVKMGLKNFPRKTW